MTINVRIDHDGSEVVIFEVPFNFSEDDLLEKLEFGMKRASQKGTTFLAVIDYDTTLITIGGVISMMDQFSMIRKLPRKSPEYRVAVVTKFNSKLYDSIAGIFEDSSSPSHPQSTTDWLIWLAKAGFALYDAVENVQRFAGHPMAHDPWIQFRADLHDGIAWCRENVPWT